MCTNREMIYKVYVIEKIDKFCKYVDGTKIVEMIYKDIRYTENR